MPAGLVYDVIRGFLRKYLERIIPDAVIYMEHARRKTNTAIDVVHALKRNGTTAYGFGER